MHFDFEISRVDFRRIILSIVMFVFNVYMYTIMLYTPPQKVAGYYVIPSEILSVRP